MGTQNQYQLFKSFRFAPFFWTQFLGAFNDNVFKTALLAIITYQAIKIGPFSTEILINICAGLFILPFFLFSATAGQLADKYEKSRLIRYIKLLEVMTMTLAGYGFYTNDFILLIGVLFLLGTQSALFGPAKYSSLPVLLDETELLGGNGLIEMGTFLAILLGTIYSGIAVQYDHIGQIVVAISGLVIAIAGYLFSRKIQRLPSPNPEMNISWNIFKQTYKSLSLASEKRVVILSILGISWFWFFGSVILTQIFNYGRLILVANEAVVTIIITCFSVGIGVGSLSCEKLSGHKIEIGLVPLGAFGLTVLAITLYFLQPHASTHDMIDLTQFLTRPHNWFLIVNFILLGFFSGIFIVPLYTLIQKRSDPKKRARIIAANNILNALFMVFASLFAIACFTFHMIIPQIYLLAGILNLLVTAYIFTLVPEFIMRFLAWSIISALYKIKFKNVQENIPSHGPAVIICNHVSFIDALIILAAIRRPVRFVMDHNIFKSWLLGFIFRVAKAIPIAPERESPEIKTQAFEAISQALENGELVAIFPEGAITRDGHMQSFKPGIEKIIKRNPVPVIPMALQGLWGSFFSRRYGKAMQQWPRRFRYKINLTAGQSIPPEKATRTYLHDTVLALRGEDD